MTDPLSISASLAGLLGLSLEVTKLLRDQVKTMKSAPQEAKHLLVKMGTLSEALQFFDQFVKQNLGLVENSIHSTGSPCNSTSSLTLTAVTIRCTELLEKLKQRVENLDRGGMSGVKGRLAWYMDKDSLIEAGLDVERFIALFGQCKNFEAISLVFQSTSAINARARTHERTLKRLEAEEHRLYVNQSENFDKVLGYLRAISALESDGVTTQTMVTDLHRVYLDQERDAVVRWISPFNVLQKHRDVSAARAPDTGKWFLGHNEFASWKGSERDIPLWCCGPPGAGKSILASLAIDHLLHLRPTSGNVAIAWFYCDYKNEDSMKTLSQTLACLLRQVLEQMASLPEAVVKLYAAHKAENFRLPPPTPAEISSLLVLTVASFSKVFIVIDALDEYPSETRNMFLSAIHDASPTHLMVTSREHILVGEVIPDHRLILIHAKEEDLNSFVRSRLENIHLARQIRNKSELVEEIVSTVVSNAGDLFIKARLHMDALINIHIIRQLRETLKEFSSDLNAMYGGIMERVSNQTQPDAELAHLILSFVTHLRRPLTVVEFQHLLAFSNDEECINFNDEDFVSCEDILSVCVGLVVHDIASNTIRLVHFTTEEYFRMTKRSAWPETHSDLARLCIHYIFKLIQADVTLHQWIGSLHPDYILARYAVDHWHEHIHGESVEGLIQEALLNPAFLALHAAIWRGDFIEDMPISELKTRTSSLHVCAHRGLPNIASRLLDSGVNVSITDDRGETPLYVAADFGHQMVVELLIKHGGDVNVQGGEYGSALQAASRDGHESVVRLLLENSGDVNAKGGRYGSALQAASVNGHEAVICLLLDYGGDVNVEGGRYGSALQAAAMEGHESVVRLLLDRGGNVNASGGRYGSALQAAAMGGHKSIVHLLLEKDADVNANGGRYGSALQAAAMNGDESVVRLLLEKGADVNVKGGRYGSALQAASLHGQESVVRLLLENRADVNTQGGEFGSAIEVASRHGHKSVVSLLLKGGADVDMHTLIDGHT